MYNNYLFQDVDNNNLFKDETVSHQLPEKTWYLRDDEIESLKKNINDKNAIERLIIRCAALSIASYSIGVGTFICLQLHVPLVALPIYIFLNAYCYHLFNKNIELGAVSCIPYTMCFLLFYGEILQLLIQFFLNANMVLPAVFVLTSAILSLCMKLLPTSEDSIIPFIIINPLCQFTIFTSALCLYFSYFNPLMYLTVCSVSILLSMCLFLSAFKYNYFLEPKENNVINYTQKQAINSYTEIFNIPKYAVKSLFDEESRDQLKQEFKGIQSCAYSTDLSFTKPNV